MPTARRRVASVSLDLAGDHRLALVQRESFDAVEGAVSLGQAVEGEDAAGVPWEVDTVVLVDQDHQADVPFT
jgi:hypothetical protein